MNNTKGRAKNTFLERSAPRSGRSALKSGRLSENDKMSALASPKFTAHKFKRFRKYRGVLVRKMREKRGMRQCDLGAPSQIRRLESGHIAEICLMDVLARLIPCPRELMKLLRAMTENLPVVCTSCRAECNYKGCNEEHLLDQHFSDLTVEYTDEEAEALLQKQKKSH